MKLVIRDFQAHAKLKVLLDPGVTTIVGPSDSGKSAVVRALRWVCLNQPDGDAFVRDGGERARVTVTMGGVGVTRSRGPGVNTYELDGTELKAFGRGVVPQDIANHLNVSEINFQGQHDSPFWFGSTAGEVSRQLNEIIDLGVIDSTLAYLNAQARQAGEEERVVAERCAQAEQEREALRVAKDEDDDLKRVELSESDLAQAQRVAIDLATLIGDITRYSEEAVSAERGLAAGVRVVERGLCWAETKKALDQLTRDVDGAKRLLPWAQVQVPHLTPIENLWNKWVAAKANEVNFLTLLGQARRASVTVSASARQFEDLDAELHTALEGKCPLCGK